MASNAYPGIVVVNEYIVQHGLASRDLMLRSFALALVAAPQLIFLREASFELPAGDELVNLRLGGSSVACVDADALAEELLEGGDERMRGGQIQSGKCGVGRQDAAA